MQHTFVKIVHLACSRAVLAILCLLLEVNRLHAGDMQDAGHLPQSQDGIAQVNRLPGMHSI